MTGLFPQPPYPWFSDQWQAFVQQVAANRLPHALLLIGQEGIGTADLAQAMAQYLLCTAPQREANCGRCKPCLLLKGDSHPDLLQVGLEEKARAIKIAQIRRISEVTANTAQQGGRKLVVIHPAETMNANAANALLKNLEEPSGDCVFILVTEQPAFLMATIRSRCSKVMATKPNREDALRWLEHNSVTNSEKLLDEAGDRPLRVMDWLERDVWGQRENLRKELLSLLAGDLPFLDCSKKLVAMDQDWVLSQLQQWLCRALAMGMAGATNTFADPLLEVLRQAPAARLLGLYDTLLQKKQHLHSGANPNPQLMMDELTMELAELAPS